MKNTLNKFLKTSFNALLLTSLVSPAAYAQGKPKTPAPQGPALPLTAFISQIQQNNGNYVYAERSAKALELREDEHKLLTRPALIGDANYMDDQRLTNAPLFMGRATRQQNYSLGIKQKFDFGLDATLSYKYIDTTIIGVDPNFFPQPHFIVASPVLELTQSLWKNFLGRQTKANQEMIRAAVEASKLQAEFDMISLKSQAENAYWRVVVARKMVQAAQGNLERAQRIDSWYSKRSAMQLSDRSDALQGTAVVAARKVELQQALDDERAACRDFNSMRGTDGETVTEKLDELKYETIIALTTPQAAAMRKDVQAANQKANADAAQAVANAESLKPDVQAYAQLSLNGRDPHAKTTVDQSFNNTYPMSIVGVRLNVPLALGTLNDTKQGYRAQAEASRVIYERKAYEAERALLDLSRRFEDAKRRLGLAIDLESAQKKKADYEKDRRGRGRSTTYQVILFEQEYATAQVARINLEQLILNIYAELKTFGGQP